MLQLTDLVVEKGGRRILHIPAFSLQKGEVMGLVGPNGAGKTTLLMVMAGLERSYRGELLAEGERLAAGRSLAYRRQLGVVFQDPQVLDTSALANVMAPLRFRGIPVAEARRRALFWLDRLGIVHLARQRARSLSGGERQRLALARALVGEPRILFLDEPFSSVDVATRAGLIQEVVGLLREYQLTAVVVSHDFTEVMLLADRVAVLMEGRVMQTGSTREVFYHPADEHIATFLGMENIWSGQLGESGLRVGPLELTLAPGVWEPQARCPRGSGAVKVGVRPESVSVYQGAALTHNGLNSFPAVVKTVSPAGPLLKVELLARAPLAPADPATVPVVGLVPPALGVDLQPGAEAVVTIPPATIHIF